jgi:SAM-dependent methyltransferase
MPPGRALDLACGTGRHALWLARMGWQVTAVDVSPTAIAALRELAGGLPIDTLVADLEKNEFMIQPAAWDLIVISLYLQKDLFAPAKEGLRDRGVLIAVTLLEDGGSTRHRLAPEELTAYFSGWEILHSFEGRRRSHAVAEIAVRKTGSAPVFGPPAR